MACAGGVCGQGHWLSALSWPHIRAAVLTHMHCTCLWLLDTEQSEHWPHGKGLVYLLEVLVSPWKWTGIEPWATWAEAGSPMPND